MRLLRGLLPAPRTALPMRPLSMRASTASWSMRFSLRMMISGALSSWSFFSRLFRLMTLRYRSLRSDVANRPPSSCTMGRRSGGMTGSTSRIMDLAADLLFRKSSATWSLLMSFRFFWPVLSETSSRRAAPSWSRSICSSRAWTPSAPMPARNFLS